MKLGLIKNYTVSESWQDTTSSGGSGVKPETGKGSRLIILHAGTYDGFVENAELIFQAKKGRRLLSSNECCML